MVVLRPSKKIRNGTSNDTSTRVVTMIVCVCFFVLETNPNQGRSVSPK